MEHIKEFEHRGLKHRFVVSDCKLVTRYDEIGAAECADGIQIALQVKKRFWKINYWSTLTTGRFLEHNCVGKLKECADYVLQKYYNMVDYEKQKDEEKRKFVEEVLNL